MNYFLTHKNTRFYLIFIDQSEILGIVLLGKLFKITERWSVIFQCAYSKLGNVL